MVRCGHVMLSYYIIARTTTEKGARSASAWIGLGMVGTIGCGDVWRGGSSIYGLRQREQYPSMRLRPRLYGWFESRRCRVARCRRVTRRSGAGSSPENDCPKPPHFSQVTNSPQKATSTLYLYDRGMDSSVPPFFLLQTIFARQVCTVGATALYLCRLQRGTDPDKHERFYASLRSGTPTERRSTAGLSGFCTRRIATTVAKS